MLFMHRNTFPVTKTSLKLTIQNVPAIVNLMQGDDRYASDAKWQEMLRIVIVKSCHNQYNNNVCI